MPQLTPGQVVPGQQGAPKLYGVDKQENTIPFQEKLMRLFKAHQYVTIKNIDDETLYWQFMPLDAETENFSDDGYQKQVYREKPEQWFIPAGQTDTMVGASAYRALDVMYKAWAAKSNLRKYKDPNSQLYDGGGQHLPRNFNFADGGMQDDFIEKAFIGIAEPTFSGYSQPVAEGNKTTQPAVTPDTPNPDSDQQIPLPSTAPNGQPTPEPDTGANNRLTTPVYAEPDAEQKAPKAKELVNAGAKK